jgi:hypothetical protein
MAKKVRRVGNSFQLFKSVSPSAIGWGTAGYAVSTSNLITPNLLSAFWTSGSTWNTGNRVFLKWIDVTAKFELGTEPNETKNKIVVFRPKDRTNNSEFDPNTGNFTFLSNLTTNMPQVPTTAGGGYDLDFMRFNPERITLLANKTANLGVDYQYSLLPVPTTKYPLFPNKTHVTRKFRIPYNAWIKNEVGIVGTGSDWVNQTFMRDPSKNVYISFFSNNANADLAYPYVSYSAVYHFAKYD